MKRSRVVLTVCAVLALAVLAAVCLPFTRSIDTTLTATEYRFDDPDYAVEHTVTIRGHDTRNLLGKGRFEGTVSVSGLEGLDGEQGLVITFLKSIQREGFVSAVDEAGFVTGGGVFGPVLPSRDYSEFVWILAYEVHDDGASYGGASARFLISGPAGRESAFALGAKLTKGSFWEPLFSE